MRKLIIIPLFLVAGWLNAQEHLIFSTVDSLSYQAYLAGNWDQLIQVGTAAVEQEIDYKNLRKRMGYAYYVKGNYFSAKKHYEKALDFDQSDADVRIYLYYCGLHLGDEVYANYHLSKLSLEIQNQLGVSGFKLLDAIDLEYNYKSNNSVSSSRSNPTYYRAGFHTQVANRLSLYQSASQYSQTLNTTIACTQREYYGALNGVLSEHVAVDLAYHYLNTDLQSKIYASQMVGNLYFAKLSARANHISVGVNFSTMSLDTAKSKQIGINAGVALPGKSNVRINSSLVRVFQAGNNRFVFSQSIGKQLMKPLWVEGSMTFGNLKNYNDNNGLYIYNSADATQFRTGITLMYTLNPNVTLVGNYTFDEKELNNKTTTIINYNQHSLSGGIIWKF
jgi:hypothetical protein